MDVHSPAVSTFVKSDSFEKIRGITQEEKSGDLYVTVHHSEIRITYRRRSLSMISGSYGSQNSAGYRDSTLLNSRFDTLYEIILITPQIQLIADGRNHKLRVLNINLNKVATLDVTYSLGYPSSLLLTNDSLYIGHNTKIIQYKCE